MQPQLFGNRFLTFNSVIRVNQIEVRRDRNAGNDEGALHQPEHVEALRDAFARGWSGGRMTWRLSWLALHDDRPNYRRIRELVAQYQHRHGDDVTFFADGYFTNALARVPQEFTRRWSLLGSINQKQIRPHDQPLPFAQLPPEDRNRILNRYPELASI